MNGASSWPLETFRQRDDDDDRGAKIAARETHSLALRNDFGRKAVVAVVSHPFVPSDGVVGLSSVEVD